MGASTRELSCKAPQWMQLLSHSSKCTEKVQHFGHRVYSLISVLKGNKMKDPAHLGMPQAFRESVCCLLLLSFSLSFSHMYTYCTLSTSPSDSHSPLLLLPPPVSFLCPPRALFLNLQVWTPPGVEQPFHRVKRHYPSNKPVALVGLAFLLHFLCLAKHY